MFRACGNTVNDTGKETGRNGGHSLTAYQLSTVRSLIESAKAVVLQLFAPAFPPGLSTVKIISLPLSEHYFYPVSTVPTINTTKGNLKER